MCKYFFNLVIFFIQSLKRSCTIDFAKLMIHIIILFLIVIFVFPLKVDQYQLPTSLHMKDIYKISKEPKDHKF